jgi:hypothetical protein
VFDFFAKPISGSRQISDIRFSPDPGFPILTRSRISGSHQIPDFRRRWRRDGVVEEEAGQLPAEVDRHGLRRRDGVDAEVVEHVPLAHLKTDIPFSSGFELVLLFETNGFISKKFALPRPPLDEKW